jgi:hypothetical protein
LPRETDQGQQQHGADHGQPEADQPTAVIDDPEQGEQLAADDAADHAEHDVEHQPVAGTAHERAGDPAGEPAGDDQAEDLHSGGTG